MITAIVLCHPQSKDLLTRRTFNSKILDVKKIACGTTRVKGADYSESSDFFPTYASYNSCLFETSVILTAWEHADELIGDNDVAVLHTDIVLKGKANETWSSLNAELKSDPDRPIGLTIAAAYKGIFNNWLIDENDIFRCNYDPMRIHCFENKIYVYDYIKKYDLDIYEFAMDANPLMIYSHQFCITRKAFDVLGDKLMRVVNRLRLEDIGFWTPHMFERLIALYLAKYIGRPKLTTAFHHFSSSGSFGPGQLSLYGPRGFKHYRPATRLINNRA